MNEVVRTEIGRAQIDPQEQDPLWFLDPRYQPMPEHDVNAGRYVFRYRPEYGDYFVVRSSEGCTLISISSELQIPFKIIKFWAGRIRSFAVAMELAGQNSQRYWEEVGRDRMDDKGFNLGGWIKMMGVLFPDSWRGDEMGQHFGSPYGDEVDAQQGGNTVIFQGVRSPESMEAGGVNHEVNATVKGTLQ